MTRKKSVFFIFTLAFCLLFPVIADAGIELQYEYYRVKSLATNDAVKKWENDKKFRKQLETEGWAVVKARGNNWYLAKTEVISSKEQLEAVMGGPNKTDAQKKVSEIYDFTTTNEEFKNNLDVKGSMNSACYGDARKTQTGNQIMRVQLFDTTNLTDISQEQMNSDFTPGGALTVMMSTAHSQSWPMVNEVSIFIHEFSHTLDSNALAYNHEAMGKDQIHYLNEITCESNALSEAWAEYQQIHFFPAEKLSWSGDGLKCFSNQIKIEKKDGGYDLLSLGGVPSTATYNIPLEGNRTVQQLDLLKIECVNLDFILRLDAAIDAKYGPGKGHLLISEVFATLNRMKCQGKNRTLQLMVNQLLLDRAKDFPELPSIVAGVLQDVTGGRLTKVEFDNFFAMAKRDPGIKFGNVEKVTTSHTTANPYSE